MACLSFHPQDRPPAATRWQPDAEASAPSTLPRRSLLIAGVLGLGFATTSSLSNGRGSDIDEAIERSDWDLAIRLLGQIPDEAKTGAQLALLGYCYAQLSEAQGMTLIGPADHYSRAARAKGYCRPGLLNNLGALVSRLGSRVDAIGWLREAEKELPHNPVVTANLLFAHVDWAANYELYHPVPLYEQANTLALAHPEYRPLARYAATFATRCASHDAPRYMEEAIHWWWEVVRQGQASMSKATLPRWYDTILPTDVRDELAEASRRSFPPPSNHRQPEFPKFLHPASGKIAWPSLSLL